MKLQPFLNNLYKYHIHYAHCKADIVSRVKISMILCVLIGTRIYYESIDLRYTQSKYEVNMINHLEDMGRPKKCIPNVDGRTDRRTDGDTDRRT